MTSRDRRELVSAEIPIEVAEALRDADMKIWEVITDAVRTELGLEEDGTTFVLERKVESLESENDVLESEIEERKAQIEENNERIRSIRQKIEKIEAQQSDYQEILSRVLGEMIENPQTNIEAYRSDLREGAKVEYGRATESTIDKVKDDIIDKANAEQLEIRPERFNGSADKVETSTSFGPELTAVSGGDDGSE